MVDFESLIFRKARHQDVMPIVIMLADDEIAAKRESIDEISPYVNAFKRIEQDPNQHLMVVVDGGGQVIATAHLTVMPSLTYKGSNRLNVEAVRVDDKYRGQGVGEWMMQQVIALARQQDCTMIQLTTSLKRTDAARFYKKLGYEQTHLGFKLMLS